MLLAAAAFLYANLFLFPATPFLLEGDQVYFWNFAQRIVGGERAYRDFLEFTPPGTGLLYSVPFALFGGRTWLPNAMDLLLGIALCTICFTLARRIMDKGPALLATCFFLIWIWSKALNGTHHWWSVLAILCALLVADRSPIAVGALLGLSCFFTQTHGVFAFIAYAIYRRSWRDIARSAASFAIVLGALEAPYIASVGLARLWYLQVVYTARYVVGAGQHLSLLGLPITWHNLPNLAQRAFVDVMLPVVYAITLWRSRAREARLLALVGAALFLEIASSPDWVRVYAVCMPAVILLIWWLPKKTHRYVWVVLAVLAAQQTIGRHRGVRTVVDLPAGRAATVPLTAEKLQWLAANTKPGDDFFSATWPGLYMPLALKNPAYLSGVTQNETTRPEDVERSIAEIDAKEVRYILWSAYNDQPDAQHPREDHLAPLREYLHGRYHRVRVFVDRDEIWERAVTQRATTPKSLHD
jgi:hypothetical protein